MRIGVDATCWANPRGYGRFTREIVTALAALGSEHEFVCVLDDRAADLFDLQSANVRRVVVPQRESPTTAASASSFRSPIDMLRLTAAVRRERLDVFFSPAVYTFFPLPPRLPAVVTIHDAIAERFPAQTLPTARARLFWRAKVGLALRQARLILTVSDFAATEIAEVHRVAPGRIRVALEAPSAAYRPSASPSEISHAAQQVGLPAGARWLTYVGGFNPHKNIDVLVRAHHVANQTASQPIFLVLVGAVDGDVFFGNVPAIRAEIDRLGTAPLVRWTGHLSDERIRHLHSGAIALVLPSDNEGFGLPAVEAAACGTPVIATTASPLPRLLEGGGIFVPPRDDAALTAAIVRLAGCPGEQQRLGDAAHRQAERLSWQQSARAVLAALVEAAA